MLKPIHLLFFCCLFLFGLAVNSAYAENEDVYLPESLSDDIFHHYQQLAAQHDEEENDYTLINNDFYENEYIRVFNYTAYNSVSLSHKLGTGEFHSSDLDALSI